MPKISKTTPPKTKRIQVVIDTSTTVDIEYDGKTARALLSGKRISEAGGDWIQWCFNIKDNEVCIDRKELEGS